MTELSSYNLADVWEAVSERVPERTAVTCGDHTLTYGQLEERVNRLAHHLRSRGVAPGDMVGVYLRNGAEYLETMLACFKISAVPVNVNFRYVDDELRYLLTDAGVVGVVHGAEFTDRLASILDGPAVWTLSVADAGSDRSGSEYEAALAASSADRPNADRGDDDLYVIYTGGTTGLPKGVVWRHDDAFFACVGGGDPMRLSGPVDQPAEVLDRIIDFEFAAYPLAPLMHAAAQWTSLSWLFCGARVVLSPGSFDPVEVWETIGRETVNTLIIVGDAMARPLCDAWDEHGPFDVSALYAVGSGGAPLTSTLKARLAGILPNAMVTDGFGSSETGAQGAQRLQPGETHTDSVRFEKTGSGTAVLGDDMRPVVPGSGVIGRVALSGRIPLRYHNDPDKTAATFVTDDEGVRWVVTGDMATVDDDGSIALLGRGSGSINTGGEKVFPEEVEAVLKAHPEVYDAVVVGIPDERWGEAVAAVVSWSRGAEATVEELRDFARTRIAGYKVPRGIVIVDEVVRSPVGKADYRWAKDAASSLAQG